MYIHAIMYVYIVCFLYTLFIFLLLLLLLLLLHLRPSLDHLLHCTVDPLHYWPLLLLRLQRLQTRCNPHLVVGHVSNNAADI